MPGRRFFREALECGFFLCRPSFTGLSLESGPRQLRLAIVDWIRGTEPGVAPADLGLDAIFFCHSPAPHLREPVRQLAAEVRDAGYRCLVWCDNERELWLPAGHSQRQAELLEEFLHGPLPPARRLAVVLRALGQAAFLSLRLATRRATAVRDLARRPWRLWAALVDSGLRLQRAAALLDATGPSLLFTTHERFRPASSFWLTRHRPRPLRVLYHHGMLSWYEQPIFSDEILSWNRTDAAELSKLAPAARVHITGNWELAFEKVPATFSNGGPELLFLSQYLREDEPAFRESTAEMLSWLREVARRCPQWRFLVKPRGPEDGIVRLLDRLPANLQLTDQPFDALLARESVQAVAAFSSCGLYVAAGRGKRAIRLRARHHRIAMPVIDEVSTSVWSAEEWARLLREMPPPAPLPPELFPAGESAIQQAAAVCLSKLAVSGRAAPAGRAATPDVGRSTPVTHPTL